MAAIQLDDVQLPRPLETFTEDKIHPDNQKVIRREENRYRLLNWLERIRLQKYVNRLGNELRKAGYNRLVIELDQLKQEYQKQKQAYNSTTFISEDAKQAAAANLKAVIDKARQIHAKLSPLREKHQRFDHYSNWLTYERKHRKELIQDAKLERRNRSQMRLEAKWIESLLIDVFRKTSGCHHIYSVDGKEITKAPKFYKSVTTPDAHYFYLLVSSKSLFGWRWLLPYSVTVARLTHEDVIANMRAATKLQVDAIWTETGQLVYRVARLESPDALPKQVNWRDAMRYFPDKKREKLPYSIGVSENRKFQWFDLASDPHILIAGKSQSGKSNLVNGIIGTLVSTHSPDELRVVLIDQKGGLEFTHWHELPHLLWDVVKTLDETQPVFEKLVSVMRQRMTKLEKVKAKDIAAYNARVDAEYRMPRVLVVIDEMNTFVGLGAKTEAIHNLIMLLVSQGRAVGVHVIASTQHPEVKVVPGRIKTNMSMRLSGAMPTVSASQIILDTPDAARIPNIPGRFVAVIGLTTIQVQVPRIFDEDIAGVCASAALAYSSVSENLPDMKEQPQLLVWNEERVMSAALEWINGHLSSQKLHKMLGDESPGERHLSKMCKRIIDQVEASGYCTDENEQRYRLKKAKGGGRYLVKLDVSDVSESPEMTELMSENSSEIA
jgi:hypothetical protein